MSTMTGESQTARQELPHLCRTRLPARQRWSGGVWSCLRRSGALTYLAIRIGVESFPPLILAGLRHLTVGLFLYPIFRRTTGIKPTAGTLAHTVVAGALLLFVGNGASAGRN